MLSWHPLSLSLFHLRPPAQSNRWRWWPIWPSPPSRRRRAGEAGVTDGNAGLSGQGPHPRRTTAGEAREAGARKVWEMKSMLSWHPLGFAAFFTLPSLFHLRPPAQGNRWRWWPIWPSPPSRRRRRAGEAGVTDGDAGLSGQGPHPRRTTAGEARGAWARKVWEMKSMLSWHPLGCAAFF